MLTAGLTGGIGSGKTTVAAIFSSLGIPVFNADDSARKMMEEDEELISAISKAFGSDIYQGHVLDRKRLAEKVFNDEHQLNILNAIVHPKAIAAGVEWLARQTAPYVIKEAALIFEAGSSMALDLVIGVNAPSALRIKRVMDRNHISREDVLARMKRQIDETLKMKLCDFVLVNDGVQALLPQVLELHQKLLAMAADKNIASPNQLL